MAYSFDQIFAADPSNPSNVAQNAAVTIFAPGDSSMTPLEITDPDGQPLANPIPVNANGFGSAFAHATLDRVAWAGGGFTGFFTSYEGMKGEAVAARAAAEAAVGSAAAAALEAAAAAQAPTDQQVDAGIARADLTTKIADVVAADPTVVAEAAALAQSDAGLARAGDPGIPEEGTFEGDNYLSAITSPTNKLMFGIRKDGSVEIPVGLIGGTLHRAGGAAAQTDPYDIIVVSGQSNATQVENLPVTVEDEDPRIKRWNATNGTIEAMPASATYLGSDFARNYVRNQPPGRNVLIVDTATGSTGFTSTSIATPPAGYHYSSGGTWDRTLTTDPLNLYARMVTRVNAAVTAAGTGARLVAMLWVQGEEDTNATTPLTTAQYAAKLDDLITAARTDFGAATLPVVIGSMTPTYVNEFGLATNRGQVHYAHVDTPRRVQSTSFVYGPENLDRQGDTIHMSAQGQRSRARLFMEGLYRAKLNVAAARPLPPQNLTVTRSGDTATVKWDAPPARATAFTVQYSINGGAWTTLTLPVAIALNATFTVTAGQPIKVRASSTNEVGTSPYTMEVSA